MIKSFLLVGLGGAIGSMFRYGTSIWLNKYKLGELPYATLISNIIGCLLIGMLIGYFQRHQQPQMFLLWCVGFCGGYTTFSTFSYENLVLWQNGNYTALISYILLSVIGGFGAVYLGYSLSK